MKYIKALTWFHFARAYNTLWSWLNLPLHTGKHYNLLDVSEAIKVIGWKPRSWAPDERGNWREITKEST